MFSIFDATLKPILCYGPQIWGYMYMDKVEKVQAKFCKKTAIFRITHWTN